MLGSMRGVSAECSKAALAAVLLAALGLAGCPSARRAAPPAPVPSGAAAGIAPPAPGATRYQVIGGESLLVILVHRGGTFASFGHNHVIASRALTGVVDVQEPPAASTFELHLPVESFTIDEPALRAGRGPGFANAVPDEARDGTRRNMLGESVLDAARFPEVVARAVSFAGGPRHFAARLELEVRGKRSELTVPVQVDQPAADRLHVTARFAAAQSALGLTPFSVMLGALKVEDLLDVELDLTARRAP